MSVHNFGTLNWTTAMKILEVQLKRILREQYSYLTCGRSDCNTHKNACLLFIYECSKMGGWPGAARE